MEEGMEIQIPVKYRETVRIFSPIFQCWHDIQKYYVRRDIIDNGFNSVADDVDMSMDVAEAKTRNSMRNRDKSDNTHSPSVGQLSFMIKEIVELGTANPNIWTPMSQKVNAIGPCVKNCSGWQSVWNDYRADVQKFVDEKGTKNLSNLQRLAYEYIKRERSKNVCHDSTITVR